MFSKSLFRKIISYTFLVLTVSLLFLLASCVTPIDDNPREEVMVRFIVDGVVVKSETIPFRSDATAPEDPVKENYVFIGWDKSFTDVRSNLDVHALFKPVEYTITKTANVKVTVVRDNRTIVLNSGDTVAKGETITVSIVLTDSQVFDSLLINGVAYENNVSIEVTEDLSIEGKIKHKDGLTTKELLDQDIIQIGTYLGEQTADFDLPAAGQNGSVITWEVLSGSSIVLNGNQAIVTRPSDENETVVLLAHFELEDEYEDVEIVVIVLKEETATPNIYATDLFISEYAEGNAGNNKYIEIFNGTGQSVNLKDYEVKLYANGATNPTNTLVFEDIYLPHGGVYVIYNPDCSAEILNRLPGGLATDSTVTFYNGDDAIALYKNGEVIDIIGEIGISPSGSWTGVDALGNSLSTSNQTLVRYESIVSPNAEFTPSEWVTLGTDVFTNVGEHEFTYIQLTPEQIVQADLAVLTLVSQTVSNLTLPDKGPKGSTITWESFNTEVITHKGVVTRGEEDVIVTMVATVSYGDFSDIKEFQVKVLAKSTTPVMEYYAEAEGLVGQALEEALRKIITETHTTKITYKNLGNYFPQTDYDPNNPSVMLLFYTRLSASDNTWNKEHVWPDSRGGNTAENDLHHIRPTVNSVNSARGNFTIGTVTSGKKEIVYKGINTGNYIGGNRFEPADEIKGDVARIIFYCATRYASLDIVSSGVAVLETLLEWNMMDAPDAYEINRNEAIYRIQGNRNPFIDNPEFANLIWG